jgi:hypothetical protein
MLTQQMDRLGKSGLKVTVEARPDEIHVGLGGTCDRETLPHLGPFLGELHEETHRVRAKQVVIDCESLYFMSSACIKCLVGWITRVKQAPAEQRYVVEFRTNKRLAWQERSLSAITRFAPQIARLA